MRKFTILASALLMSGLMVSAASAGTAHKKTAMPYMKPGASVYLTHNYDGKTAVGEIENITVTLTEAYDTGTLTATILPTDGLTIYSDTRMHSFAMNGAAEHTLNVQVSANTDGVYYLNLQMVVEDGTGNVMRRSGGVAIYVGANALPQKQRALIAGSADVAGEPGLIVMDAEEEITTKD